jgi:predicted dehydrogenase/threonine dehydrogenase-like Zn-dependent dehydrogenase
MRQILQNLKDGETRLVEIPAPSNRLGNLLIKTNNSVVSAGTERMLVNFGKANYIDKARQQPDKVKQVLNKVKTDGLIPTIEAVTSKLEQPLPLGYCNAGIVIDSEVSEFKVGDRVISNGHHAEIVRVPGNLCAKIPDNVDDESAAFTVLGSIALQGVRLISPTIGETIVVSGLGLIGLIAVQILKANGCRVLGIDFDERKCALAREFGADTVNLSVGEDPLLVANSFSRGRGVDAVLITAATDSNEPMSQAANMLRKRGRIVLVGVVGLELSRAEFYEKEITFQVSCSYGPGRYDTQYEDQGRDYPVGFVRWTEQRNFEAVLDMISDGAIKILPLITHRFDFEDALSAYDQLNNSKALGIVLAYSCALGDLDKQDVLIGDNDQYYSSDAVTCGFLGGGNYASRVLIPAFRKSGAQMETLVTSRGINSSVQGKKNGFNIASTSESSVINSKTINTVVIATQHNLHALQVIEALKQHKHVFVEKPLAINTDELLEIKSVYESIKGEKPKLMVGFNRRFAPHIIKMKNLLSSQDGPKIFIMTVNAGEIPGEHWTQDALVGGGRIIGEGCHFIDLLKFLTGSKIAGFSATKVGDYPGIKVRSDKVSITLTFEDGSFGTIHYLSNGGKAFPKERLEIFCNDAVLQLDNFKKLKGFGWKGFNKMNLLTQNKGQYNCVKSFVDSIENGGKSPISFEDIFEVSKFSIEISNYLSKT